MDEQGSTRSARVPIFKGTKDEFQVWWTRFMAYACVMKFILAIGRAVESTLPSKHSEVLDLKDDKGVKADAARSRND